MVTKCFFGSPGKVHTKRKTSIKKNVALGDKKICTSVFTGQIRPIATVYLAEKKKLYAHILAPHFSFMHIKAIYI